MTISLIPITGMPEIQPGDILAEIIAKVAGFRDGDVLVVTQKIVSKAEGRLEAVDPSDPLVGCGIACREADRESERVEPHGAARPGRHAPAELPLTPQDALPAPKSWCPGFVCEHAAAASESA